MNNSTLFASGVAHHSFDLLLAKLDYWLVLLGSFQLLSDLSNSHLFADFYLTKTALAVHESGPLYVSDATVHSHFYHRILVCHAPVGRRILKLQHNPFSTFDISSLVRAECIADNNTSS